MASYFTTVPRRVGGEVVPVGTEVDVSGWRQGAINRELALGRLSADRVREPFDAIPDADGNDDHLVINAILEVLRELNIIEIEEAPEEED